jgi:hypothetical protein
MDSWIHRNVELYGKTEEEQIVKMTKDVDDKIHTRRYEQDQAKVREEDKSIVLLPAEVRLRRHAFPKNVSGLNQLIWQSILGIANML